MIHSPLVYISYQKTHDFCPLMQRRPLPIRVMALAFCSSLLTGLIEARECGLPCFAFSSRFRLYHLLQGHGRETEKQGKTHFHKWWC